MVPGDSRCLMLDCPEYGVRKLYYMSIEVAYYYCERHVQHILTKSFEDLTKHY